MTEATFLPHSTFAYYTPWIVIWVWKSSELPPCQSCAHSLLVGKGQGCLPWARFHVRGATITDLTKERVLPLTPYLRKGSCVVAEGGGCLHLNPPELTLFFWWNMLGEVGGGEDRGSYWVSLILSFVSLWIAFVYTVSSGQEFLQQKACIHVGIFRSDPSFLLVFHLLTWLSSLQPDLKGGLEIFNLFSILLLCGNEILKRWLGANMLMCFWWEKRMVMSRLKSNIYVELMLVESLVMSVWHLEMKSRHHLVAVLQLHREKRHTN